VGTNRSAEPVRSFGIQTGGVRVKGARQAEFDCGSDRRAVGAEAVAWQSPEDSGDASVARRGTWPLPAAASRTRKLISADKAATGCGAARIAPHATGLSIQTGISCRRAAGASTSVQRAAVPAARPITL